MLEEILVDGILHGNRKMSDIPLFKEVWIRVGYHPKIPVNMNKGKDMCDFCIFDGLL
jgi:hypothetical protein